MLVTTKRNFRTSQEIVAEYAEGTNKMLDAYRLTDHTAMKESWRKRGYMHSSDFIHRIKRCNPNLFVQQQINFPDEWGFYADVRGKLTYLSGFKKGWVPEYSSITVDDRDLPDGEIRGWRTCLVRLLGMGVITWEQVCREFGDAPGNGGAKWRKDTLSYRNANSSRIAARNLLNKIQYVTSI